MKKLIGLATLLLLYTTGTPAGEPGEIVVYKSPTCGCCNGWVDYLRDNGFRVETHNTDKLTDLKAKLGLTDGRLMSCHTAVVDGYLVEGHVPVDDIRRLLQERPDVAGLTVPGMPMGSPGMEGHRKDNYKVLTFTRTGETSVFSQY